MGNKRLDKISKGVFLLLCLFIVFGAMAQTSNEIVKPQVYHIQNYFTEAYLVKGNSEKLILIETGVSIAGYQDSLVNSIKKLGFRPENISLAIVTHGHCDHAGNARFLQQTYRIEIAGSEADLEKFNSGKTELVKCEDISIWGKKFRPYLDLSYQPFTPDIIVGKTPIDLNKYGLSGKIIPINGGHTPGDLLVLIGESLFVGDAFLGTFKAQGGALFPDGHHVREHFWHEDKLLAGKNLKVIEKIAIDNKVKTLYPTHNGPVSTYELVKYIKEESLLKLLSKKQTDMLNNVIIGKSELQNKILADSFIFQTSDNNQYTKAEFIEAFITNPKVKMESLSAEDFRIISSNESTIVMSYILQSITSGGKEVHPFLMTNTYSREKGGWKLLFANSSKQ
jgi:glyoxylase-like metal-dependent hydrolase (beta-lactamase superfamily II)